MEKSYDHYLRGVQIFAKVEMKSEHINESIDDRLRAQRASAKKQWFFVRWSSLFRDVLRTKLVGHTKHFAFLIL